MSDRTLVIGKESVVKNGQYQRNCLSPVLFGYSIEDINTKDDILIVSVHKDFYSANINMRNKVNKFKNIFNTLNLTFNPEKSSTMYLAKRFCMPIELKAAEVKFL